MLTLCMIALINIVNEKLDMWFLVTHILAITIRNLSELFISSVTVSCLVFLSDN